MPTFTSFMFVYVYATMTSQPAFQTVDHLGLLDSQH